MDVVEYIMMRQQELHSILESVGASSFDECTEEQKAEYIRQAEARGYKYLGVFDNTPAGSTKFSYNAVFRPPEVPASISLTFTEGDEDA